MRKFILALAACAMVALAGCAERQDQRFHQLKVVKVENVDRVPGRATYNGTLTFDKEITTPEEWTFLYASDGKTEKKIRAYPLSGHINGKKTTRLFIQEDEKFIKSLKDKRVYLLK